MKAAYAITRELDASVEETVARITASLAEEGFGVLTTIDVRETLSKKLDQHIDPYVILGACNPRLASTGLGIEPDLGVLLPCNVVVRALEGKTHIAAMEPFAALQLSGNPDLEPLATEARERIQRAVDAA